MVKAGDSYLFMTVTYYFTGRVSQVFPTTVVIDDAARVLDTGADLKHCLTAGVVAQHEFVGDGVVLPWPCIALPWRHALPGATKRSK